MNQRPRVFLDASVMKHSYRSRTVLRPHLVEEDPTAREQGRLRAEIDLLSRVAELARSGEIELLWHRETQREVPLQFPERRSSVFGGVSITLVDGPVKYSRYITPPPLLRLRGHTPRTMTIDFAKSLKHKRFLQLQRACGAYQGDHAEPNPDQLLDAFHVWCAEHAKATHFLTNDFDLIHHVRNHKRWPPQVKVVSPSELLSEIDKQIAGRQET